MVRTKKYSAYAMVMLALVMIMTACSSGGGSSTATDAPKSVETPKPDDAKQKLVIYTGRDKNVFDVVLPKFNAKYPNIEVETLEMGAQQILERVRGEKANPQGDFWWGGTQSALMTAADEGLLDTYKPSGGDQVPALYKDAQDRWYGEMLLPEVIMYNSDVYKNKADAPQDWDDIIDPKYKGKIVIRDVLASGTMRTIYSAMIYRQGAADPQKGYDFLKKLDANTKEYAADPTQMQLKIERQEGAFTLWNLQDVMLQKELKKRPFDFVYPKSGAPILVDGVALIKGAPNKDAAAKFYDFIFDPDIRAEMAEKLFQIPTRSDISKDKLPAWLNGLELKPLDIDWKVMADKEKEWMGYWDQNIKGKGSK